VSWIREQDELSLFVSVLTFGEIEKGLAKLDYEKRRQRLRNWVDHDLKRHSTDGRISAYPHHTSRCRHGGS